MGPVSAVGDRLLWALADRTDLEVVLGWALLLAVTVAGWAVYEWRSAVRRSRDDAEMCAALERERDELVAANARLITLLESRNISDPASSGRGDEVWERLVAGYHQRAEPGSYPVREWTASHDPNVQPRRQVWEPPS